MKKNDRGPLGLLLALCMTLLLVTPALAGVTDVTGGSKTTVNTVVRNNYTDTHEKKTFALTGKTTTFEGAAAASCARKRHPDRGLPRSARGGDHLHRLGGYRGHDRHQLR